jgi:hypothetical protein
MGREGPRETFYRTDKIRVLRVVKALVRFFSGYTSLAKDCR